MEAGRKSDLHAETMTTKARERPRPLRDPTAAMTIP